MKNLEFSNFLLVNAFLGKITFTNFQFYKKQVQSYTNFFFSPLQIVDSIMALFRVDFSGRGELADRQQKLAQMLSRLQKIAEGSIVTCDKTENTAGCLKLP